MGPARGTKMHYLLFDVHYYLAGWQPVTRGSVKVVGGLFHPVLGRYALPCGEGEVLIHEKEGGAWVTMLTRSAGQTYDHPLVSVAHADTRFDYGWYSHVKVSVESEQLLITRVEAPKLTVK